MKNIKIIILLLLISFVSTACGNDSEGNADKSIQGQKISKEAKTFELAVFDYNKIYKTALFATDKGKKVEAENSTKESYRQWKTIVEKYAQKQPAEYKKTKDWILRLREIENLEEAAVELVLKDKPEEAHERLETVRKKLMELRIENGIKNISDDMLIFHDIMEDVVETEARDDVLKHLSNLKISFTVLKEYHQGDKTYKELVKNLENTISGLESRDERIFNDAKLKLKPAFIALYLQFG